MSLFQKIIDKEINADIVYEDDLCLAFRDIQPQAPTHILMIPKKPIESLGTVSDEDQQLLGHMLLKISHIAEKQGLAEAGYRVVANTNQQGGQSVYHLHFHLLGGRQMQWPQG